VYTINGLTIFLEEVKERERIFDAGLDEDKDGTADRYRLMTSRIALGIIVPPSYQWRQADQRRLAKREC
jgi:hypothetical protein